jgi:hypothetical protein
MRRAAGIGPASGGLCHSGADGSPAPISMGAAEKPGSFPLVPNSHILETDFFFNSLMHLSAKKSENGDWRCCSNSTCHAIEHPDVWVKPAAEPVAGLKPHLLELSDSWIG